SEGGFDHGAASRHQVSDTVFNLDIRSQFIGVEHHPIDSVRPHIRNKCIATLVGSDLTCVQNTDVGDARHFDQGCGLADVRACFKSVPVQQQRTTGVYRCLRVMTGVGHATPHVTEGGLVTDAQGGSLVLCFAVGQTGAVAQTVVHGPARQARTLTEGLVIFQQVKRGGSAVAGRAQRHADAQADLTIVIATISSCPNSFPGTESGSARWSSRCSDRSPTGALGIEVGAGAGHVEGERAKCAQALPHTQIACGVKLVAQQSTVQGRTSRQALGRRALPEHWIMPPGGIVVAAQAGTVPPNAFTEQVAQRGVGLREALDTAIGFGHHDLKFTTASGHIQVVDLIRAGGHVSGIDGITVLKDFN
nr:hypothetical protein [Tanacetum cinerariifolium]